MSVFKILTQFRDNEIMSNENKSTFIWNVETLRFTLFFPVTSSSHIKEGLWEKITGELPQNRTAHPKEKLLVEEGMWNDNQLSVSARPERVDIIISPTPVMELGLPTIGVLDEVMIKASSVLDQLPFDGVTRIAFGLALKHSEENHATAYQSLKTLLPNVKIAENARDFLYQINIPTESRTNQSIEINRLQHWAAIRMAFITANNLSMTGNNSSHIELFATSLDLDINTNSANSLTNSVDTRSLMNELIEEALSIAKEKRDD